jgi:hypothetical protein
VLLAGACGAAPKPAVATEATGVRCVPDAPDALGCEQRCAERDFYSCLLAGTALLRTGEHERAQAFLDVACHEGFGQACVLLREESARGDGQPADFARAAYYHAAACRIGFSRDCAGAHTLFDEQEGGFALDAENAAAIFRNACERGDGRACYDFGLMVEAKLRTQAGGFAPWYSLACLSGDRYSCDTMPQNRMRAARFAGRERAASNASAMVTLARASVYATACEQGLGAGCYRLGELFTEGGALPQDAQRAVQWFERACGKGDVAGCLELSRLLETPLPLVPSVPLRLARSN